MIHFEENGPWVEDDAAWQAANATADPELVNRLADEAYRADSAPAGSSRNITLEDTDSPASEPAPPQSPTTPAADDAQQQAAPGPTTNGIGQPPEHHAGLINEDEADPHRLAELFLRSQRCGDELTLRFWRDEWWRWSGTHYSKLPDAELAAQVTAQTKAEADRCCVESMRRWTGKGKQPQCFKVTRNLVSNIIGAMEGRTILSGKLEQPSWLGDATDQPPAAEILSLRNGLLHLPRRSCSVQGPLPHSPQFFSPNSLEFEYDPEAPCPRWEGFLRSLWPEDEASIELLQAWFGYCLLPVTHFQKLLMIVGPPRSGKGVIGRTLVKLVGRHNCCTPTLAAFAQQFGLQPMQGKLVALVSDARLSHRLDGKQILERMLSISGEDDQDIQRKHRPTLEAVKLFARLTVMTNELPTLRDDAGAFMSRVLLLRMTRDWTGREDRTLDDCIAREMPGVLAWALRGRAQLETANGFSQPPSGQEMLDRLRELISPVRCFIDDCCEVGSQFSIDCTRLYHRWKDWCDEQGRDHVGTVQAFGRDLHAALPNVVLRRPRFGASRIRVYSGVKLRETLEDENDF